MVSADGLWCSVGERAFDRSSMTCESRGSACVSGCECNAGTEARAWAHSRSHSIRCAAFHAGAKLDKVINARDASACCYAEIQQPPLLCAQNEKQVRWLDVTMNDAAAMHRAQQPCDLCHHCKGCAGRARGLQPLLERDAAVCDEAWRKRICLVAASFGRRPFKSLHKLRQARAANGFFVQSQLCFVISVIEEKPARAQEESALQPESARWVWRASNTQHMAGTRLAMLLIGDFAAKPL